MDWSKDEIARLATSDDLHIAPFRDDGKSYGTLTWIWSVVVDDHLYARAYSGKSSRWYKAARAQGAGRITAADMTRDVKFTPVTDEALNVRIDEAYFTKYGSSRYLAPMISESARAATIEIKPQS